MLSEEMHHLFNPPPLPSLSILCEAALDQYFMVISDAQFSSSIWKSSV